MDIAGLNAGCAEVAEQKDNEGAKTARSSNIIFFRYVLVCACASVFF